MFLTHNQGPGILEGAPEDLEEVPVVYEGGLGVHYVVPGVHQGVPTVPKEVPVVYEGDTGSVGRCMGSWWCSRYFLEDSRFLQWGLKYSGVLGGLEEHH